MVGLKILIQFFESNYPQFLSQRVPFSFTSFFIFFIHIICKRSHQGSPGVTKRGSLGFPWVPLGSLGFPWVALGYLGFPWVPLGSLGFPWVPLGSLGCPWVPLGSLGFPWVPLGSLGFPWV